MSNIEAMGTKLHNAQHRVAILAHNTEEFLKQPALLATVMEELAIILDEVEQQYEEVLRLSPQSLGHWAQRGRGGVAPSQGFHPCTPS